VSDPPTGRKPTISFTVGSKVSVRSAGQGDEVLVSNGTFRGLVSIGGDSSLALELEAKGKGEKGRIRLIPLSALFSIDIVVAVQPEEEKRVEPAAAGYFR
jgi:hypothetical protein